MAFTEEQLARRRPAWEALSRLYLDTRLGPGDHAAIAKALTDAGFTADEAEQVLHHEVGPVLRPNLRVPAGVWDAFDPAWLEAEILRRRNGWRRWLPAWSGFRVVRADSLAVRARMEPAGPVR